MNRFVFDTLRDMGIYIPSEADCLYCGDGWFCFFHWQEQNLTVRHDRLTTVFQKLKMDRFLCETLRDMGIYIPDDQADCSYCGGGRFCFFHRQQQELRVDTPEDFRLDTPEDFRVDTPEDLRVDQQEIRVDQPEEIRVDQPEEIRVDQQEIRVDQPEEIRVDQPEEIRVDQPEEISVDQPEEIRVDQSEDLPVDQPEEIRVDQPEEISVDQPEEIMMDQPEEIMMDQPEEIRVDQSEDLPVDQPEEIRVDQPEEISVDQPDDLRTLTETEPTIEETLPIPSTSSHIETIPKDETLASDDVISSGKTFAGLRKLYENTPLTLADPILVEIPERNPLIIIRLDLYSDEMRELIAYINQRALIEVPETLGPEGQRDRFFTETAELSSTSDAGQQSCWTAFIGSCKQTAGRVYHKIDEFATSVFGRTVMPSPQVGLATVLVIPLVVVTARREVWREGPGSQVYLGVAAAQSKQEAAYRFLQKISTEGRRSLFLSSSIHSEETPKK
ncbi:uncharacterized protein LOC122820993 isoform X2 [Gambusia affinis]|uniref:uncharacterized protein LOC122820993 isoform X2 n=1 Tax=Gambusia affinis TaxID=33528 RepID=UPI001CDD7ABE|nr:uncharacterized protein LOC122820993 isoform X2 [Gambusia affinis]